MKLFKLPITIVLTLTWLAIATNGVRSQSGNMSDVTMPNPGEIAPDTTGEVSPEENTGSDPTTGEDVTTGENPDTPSETPTEESIVDDETPPAAENNNPIAGENDADSRNIANENVMEAIADNNDGSEPEVVTNENDFGVTLGENTAAETPVDSIETADTNVNADNDNAASLTQDSSDTNVTEETPVTDASTQDDAATTDNVTEETVTEDSAEQTETDRATTTEEETETAAEEETEEEVAESDDNAPSPSQEVDRLAYEVQVQESPTDVAIQMQEEFQLTQLMGTSGLQLYGQIPSVKDISSRLAQLEQQTGKKPAFVNISLQSNQLEAFVVLPNEAIANQGNSLVATTELNKINSPNSSPALTIRETVKNTSRKDIMATATQFRQEVSDSSKLDQNAYLQSSQELYKVLIEPIEAQLKANNIDILVFSMDSGLRLLPLAALHDGKQFLIEKYAVAIVPSFGLTDTRYVSLDQSSILAMGASEFTEQAALPTMPIELQTIVSQPRHGEIFINEQFTLENFKAQNKRETPFPIVHLGTHAEFKAGSLNDSYIQFYDDKLKIPQLQELSNELGWNSDASPIELLVLSACETALGDEEAELGFAGLAVQAGVKSALASLWYVSDIGTLALMGEFYDQLGDTLIKAEALRQTQLKMLEGNVRVNNRQVELSRGENLSLPPEFPAGTLTLDHPYFWSAFTLIGNWN